MDQVNIVSNPMSSKHCAVCQHCGSSLSQFSCRRMYCSNKCRQKVFQDRFKAQNQVPYKRSRKVKPRPRYKPGSRTNLTGGLFFDGKSYLAHISVGGVVKTKRYSIRRLGVQGARMAAALQRTAWVIEMGVWNPNEGDPFKILRYADTFTGNSEYVESVVDRDDVSSPFIAERENLE